MQGNRFEVSKHGLEKWMAKLYEKFGWEHLEKVYGHNPDKMRAYMKSIDNLIEATKEKMVDKTMNERDVSELRYVLNKSMILKRLNNGLCEMNMSENLQDGGAGRKKKSSKKSSKKY
jgi:flavin-dependent dehydrogenase